MEEEPIEAFINAEGGDQNFVDAHRELFGVIAELEEAYNDEGKFEKKIGELLKIGEKLI